MQPKLHALLERLADLLEKRYHAGIHHYLKHGYDVVYHGQAGRFRVYSAHAPQGAQTGAMGQLHDVSNEPRMSGENVFGSDAHLPKNMDDLQHPLNPAPLHAVMRRHSKHPLSASLAHGVDKELQRRTTHRTGAFAFANAHTADEGLTRLGLPQHKLTMVVTSTPLGRGYTQGKPNPIGPMRFNQTTHGSAIAHYDPGMHHAAMSANTNGVGIDAHTIAHEWVHHHQHQLSRHDKHRLQRLYTHGHAYDALRAKTGAPDEKFFARDYSRTNWKEWHATSIEGAIKHRQPLHPIKGDGETDVDMAHPDTVKQAINAYPRQSRPLGPLPGEPPMPNAPKGRKRVAKPKPADYGAIG